MRNVTILHPLPKLALDPCGDQGTGLSGPARGEPRGARDRGLRQVRRYRTLMRHIPTHKAFEVKLADEERPQ